MLLCVKLVLEMNVHTLYTVVFTLDLCRAKIFCRTANFRKYVFVVVYCTVYFNPFKYDKILLKWKNLFSANLAEDKACFDRVVPGGQVS